MIIVSLAMEAAMSAKHFEGKLATSNHPLRYIADIALPICIVFDLGLPFKP